MKMLFEQLASDLARIRKAAQPTADDGLLIAARVLLYVVLAGMVLAMVMSIIALVSYLAGQGMALRRPLFDPVWQPVCRHLLALAALGTVLRMIVRLLALIGTADSGDVFNLANVERLEALGGAIIGLQALSFIAALIGVPIGGSFFGFPVAIQLSPGGVAIALLLFILSRVFRHGVALRDDLEGTV